MSEKLTINQKIYLPSAELGKKFNYSSDYVSRLARDEKVLGTRIGRQWFVEPESLRTYFQQLEVEKSIHQENLRQQRKLELKKHSDQKNTTATIHSTEKHPLLAAGQALAIVLCGALVGVLTFSVYTNGLQWEDIGRGAETTVSQVTAEVFEGFSLLAQSYLNDQVTVANSLNANAVNQIILEATGPRFVTDGHYTTFPLVKNETASTSSSSVSISQAGLENGEGYLLPFSDDLLVEEVGNELRVRPVFRDDMGELYQLSAIPVVTGDEDQ